MENYNKVKKYCDENKIELLTLFDEFESKRTSVTKKYYQYVCIDFVGTCGHKSSAIVTNFIKRKTGFICKECVTKKSKDTMKIKSNASNATELDAIKLIEEYLSPTYNIIRTKEGCKADLIIQKKDHLDKYIPIQLKSTQQICYGMYSFKYINKEYDNMLIICICISEKKIWVFPYKDISHLKYLNISSNSKYNSYMVNNNDLLSEHIEIYSNECYRNNLLELIKPISIFQEREQEYVRKRETIINFLKYEYPEVQNTPTDFIVNGKKVQEKVAGICKNKRDNVLAIYLSPRDGKNENNTPKFRTYRLGENDYYWIHSSIDNRFWIIPEKVLYNKGYISAADETKPNKTIQIRESTDWIKLYKYNYNNINKEAISNLFI